MLDIYSQAEMTSLYIDYIKINENSGIIKSAKISGSTTILITNEGQDTINISYYDKNGLLKKEVSQFTVKAGEEIKRTVQKKYFVYDEYGRLTVKLDSTNNVFKKTVITTEDNGNITGEEIYDSKNFLRTEISHDYDNLSRLIESNEKEIYEKCKTVKKYTYDSYSNMVSYKLSSTCTDSNYKSLNITFVYRYDSKNNILEKNTLYSDKNFKTESFTYGLNGKVNQSYILTGQDKYTVHLYYYDKSNFLVKQERTEVYGDERKKFTKNLTYDKFGNVLEVTETNEANEQTFKIKYVYDYH
ncbi:MAG TPA: hypothetical protein VJ455_09360 [Ignavibacteria bacterium]|nr:hypothetical protein [Ignavibacteria bacterium]